MSFEKLPSDSPLLVNHSEPEMMAIGDSLFNGVRSLTIDRALAKLSAVAMVADGLGIRIVNPDYRRPVLLDVEEELRDGVDLDRIWKNVQRNAQRWIDEEGEWSNKLFFDNISIAGASYQTLHTATAGTARAQATMLAQRLLQSEQVDFALAAQLYFTLNTAFLLNPSGQPDLDDLTPLEQVASRNPKRLLINIGSNEGIFHTGVTANFTREIQDRIKTIPELARKLGAEIQQQCSPTMKVYFNLLVRPRVIGNLAPRSDHDLFNPPDGGYFDRYINRLGATGRLSGAQMEKFDQLIDQVNTETKAALSQHLGDRVHFVDIYSLSEEFDVKHYGPSRAINVRRGTSTIGLSNLPLSVFPIFGGFRHGGLFSLDNMHLTTVGYALMANRIGAAIAAAEGLDFRAIDPQESYEDDTLLQDIPCNIGSLAFLLSFLGVFGGADR